MHVRRSGFIPEDPRMRAYWKFHVDGKHRVPREGVQPDHFFACSWCRPQLTITPESQPRLVYVDSEWEQFLLPEIDAVDPIGAIRGRLG